MKVLDFLMYNFQNSFIYNATKDFFFPLFLAFVSGVFAYIIFFRQIIIDRKNAESTKNEDLESKSTYFAITVHNSIENAEGQNSNLKELIDDLQTEEINSLPLFKHPIYDLKIISQKINTEDYLLSYLKFYSHKSKLDVLNEFKKIVDSCAIIYDIFIQNENSLETKLTLDDSLRRKFSENANQSTDLFGICLEDMKNRKDPLFNELYDLYKKSLNLRLYRDEQVISAQHHILFKPLLDILNKWHENGIHFNERIGDLWVKTQNCVDLYSHLKYNNDKLRELLSENHNYTGELIQIIKDSSLELRTNFLK